MAEKFPEEVIAVSSRGRREARVLVERGEYCRYTYLDPQTAKLVRKGKESIWLKNERGELEQLFLIPLKDKFLAIREKGKRKIKVWDAKKKMAVELFCLF